MQAGSPPLHCPRCHCDLSRSAFRVAMFNVSPGQVALNLPVLTVLKHWDCGGLVYVLDRRAIREARI